MTNNSAHSGLFKWPGFVQEISLLTKSLGIRKGQVGGYAARSQAQTPNLRQFQQRLSVAER